MTLETVVCCMSIEQSKEANEMLLDTARGLRERGYDVVWSHVGDDALFNEELLSVCNFCYLHGRPHTGSEAKDTLRMAGQIGNQIKESMRHALAWNPRSIVYMEGDKNSFVPYVERLAQPILKGEADLAVATRSWDAFHAFPKVQQFWEGLFNLYAGFRAGFKTDWIYGPKAFTQETGGFMLDYKAGDFGAIIHPLAAALKKGKRVVGVNVAGFPQDNYMKKYKDINFLKHFAWRMMSFWTNVKGLHSGLRS